MGPKSRKSRDRFRLRRVRDRSEEVPDLGSIDSVVVMDSSVVFFFLSTLTSSRPVQNMQRALSLILQAIERQQTKLFIQVHVGSQFFDFFKTPEKIGEVLVVN